MFWNHKDSKEIRVAHILSCPGKGLSYLTLHFLIRDSSKDFKDYKDKKDYFLHHTSYIIHHTSYIIHLHSSLSYQGF